jgi:hypothetical protein
MEKIKPLIYQHACDEYIEATLDIEKKGLFSNDKIPQLNEVS